MLIHPIWTVRPHPGIISIRYSVGELVLAYMLVALTALKFKIQSTALEEKKTPSMHTAVGGTSPLGGMLLATRRHTRILCTFRTYFVTGP